MELKLQKLLIFFKMNYEPPDEVIRENSAAANHHRNCDFELIIHDEELQEATVWFQTSETTGKKIDTSGTSGVELFWRTHPRNTEFCGGIT